MQEEEEQELEKYILGEFTWEKLPPNVKKRLENSKEVWREKVVKYSVRHQLRWKTNLVRTMVLEEKTYYGQIVRMSRMSLMLYPYHLSDVLIKGLRVTPFKYYLEMMQDVMKSELSYDRLPNFTAADCVRLLGVGRNEFIDIMNKCRSKGWIWKMKKGIVKDLLPSQPCEFDMDYWWVVHVGFVSEEDIKNTTEVEHATIDILIDSIERGLPPRCVGEFDKKVIKSLYAKGLIYLDVPINYDDYIAVPPLENFVMNRVSGDYFENLLYKIFVSTDERTSVEKLAEVLDIDIEMVKSAISMYCRLGFAKKKNVEPLSKELLATEPKWHISWLEPENQSSRTRNVPDRFIFEANSDGTQEMPVGTPPRPQPLAFEKDSNVHNKRIGFVFDYTLTALLMMGNLGPGLKSHAVTMYEVGKLADESMDDFIAELDKVQEISEGEAQRYHDHAVTLKNTLKFLRRNALCPVKDSDGGVDMLRCERLSSLEMGTRERILNQNYALLISMAPITNESHAITSCIPLHMGPTIPEVNSAWFKLYLYYCAGSGPNCRMYARGRRVKKLPSIFAGCNAVRISPWMHEPHVVNVANLLPVLNDVLLDSPALVQVYDDSDNLVTLDVAFPFETAPEEEKPAENYTIESIEFHPVLQKLQKELRLDTGFGFVTMMKLEKGGKVEWVPEQLCYGLPLGSEELNRRVCDKIVKFRLFGEENLARHSKNTRELSLNLLDFIAQFLPKGEVDVDAGLIPYPGKDIEFVEGKLVQVPSILFK